MFRYKTEEERQAGFNIARKKASDNWRKKNKEKLREVSRQWRLLHPDKKNYRSTEKSLLAGAKFRAKEKNLPFNLTLSDIIIPEYCPVLGIKLTSGHGSPVDGSPSLDKFIPELGYVVGNICVISNKANIMKSNATAKEVSLLLDWMLNRKSISA